MAFYSFEMVLVGIILLSGMTVGGLKIWLKRRHVSLEQSILKDDLEKQLDTSKNEKSTLDKTKDN